MGVYVLSRTRSEEKTPSFATGVAMEVARRANIWRRTEALILKFQVFGLDFFGSGLYLR